MTTPTFKLESEVSFLYREKYKVKLHIKHENQTSIMGSLKEDCHGDNIIFPAGQRKMFFKKHITQVKNL